jgi:hypothetical protein
VVDVELLAAETACLIEPVPAQANQIAVQSVDAGVGRLLRPVQRDTVLEELVLEEFLTLEDHRDAGSGKHHRGAKGRALAREPAAGIAGPDLLWHPRMTVGHFVV